jgi:hypothetical protein
VETDKLTEQLSVTKSLSNNTLPPDPLRAGRILTRAVVPFGRQGGFALPDGDQVELAIGRDLLAMALMVLALLAVMLVLARTRRSPR